MPTSYIKDMKTIVNSKWKKSEKEVIQVYIKTLISTSNYE